METPEIRVGPEGSARLAPGTRGNPYPVYGEGAGVGVGSACEDASRQGKPCCASCAQSSPGWAPPPPLVTGRALDGTEPSRGDLFADPFAPAAPALEPARASAPSGPAFLQTARPSPFALPKGRDCEDAPCDGFVRARDLMVQYVPNGTTWPMLPARGT